MKRWIYGFATIFGAIVPMFLTAAASAQAVSISHTITITARVLPTHTIILDKRGNIDRIISNTTENVKTPVVYSQKVSKTTQRPLAPQVYAAYRQLVKPGKSRVGLLYERPAGINAALPLLNLRHTSIKNDGVFLF